MAETSTTTNNKNGSPLVNLAQDHLFSILLRLPIESILSFAMSCKRFRSLTSSDFLWESLCKRDWGESSVNAFKSSCPIVPWMWLYKQGSHLECVSCHKLSDPDVDLALPNPRASHSLNFVSNCLVLFGGGCEGGRHLDDTWVAYIGNDFRKKLNWQKVNLGIPSGRFGHSCVVSGDYLVLFGGINDRGNRHNDTWVGQVACHENHSITLSWRLLDVGSIAPPPRGAHAACCIDNRKMVVHGGIGFDGLRLGDTWVLEISENFCFGSWHEVMTVPSPPARSGHTLTYTGRNQLVLFGGRGAVYEVLSDLWFLDASEGSFKWVQIHYQLQNVPEGSSLPRVGHSATLVLGGWILIHGGEDSLRHRKNDFWALNTKAIPSSRLEQAVLNSPKVWKRVDTVGYKPNCRSFHRACADYSGRYLYVFGGMVDGLLQPAEPAGLRFNGELLLVELLPLL
ncbi:F-box/kelch-repeat protein At1g51550 [Pistacia vera]|uniref:F-box/kelch-repeat protein At1g51550 n=1 Tax=Pistacia vera TaxID=55513 RepID=UPI0012638C37|nr:F-box/kelch-repeat protein At1g51550 [Pistacia vera]